MNKKGNSKKALSSDPWAFIAQFLCIKKFGALALVCALSDLGMVVSKLSLTYLVEDIILIAERYSDLTWSLFREPATLIVVAGTGVLVSVFVNSHAWRYFSVPFQIHIMRKIFLYIQKKDYDYFIGTHTGRIAQKVSEIPYHSMLVVDTLIHTIMRHYLNVVVGVFLLFLANNFIGGLAFIWSCLFLLFCTYKGVQCGHFSSRSANQRGILSGNIVDSVSNTLNVRLFSNEKHENHRFETLSKEYIDAGDDLYRFQRNMLFQSTVLAVLFFGAMMFFLIQNLMMGETNLAQTSVQITLLVIIFNNLENLPFNIRVLMTDIGGLKDGLNLLSLNAQMQEETAKEKLEVSKGTVCLSHVVFDYNTKENIIFQDFNLKIFQKQKLGVIGPSGAGKSTLLSVLLRFYDIQDGRILIDGQDITNVARESLRQNIAVIPQDTSLFHRSLIENIRYGRLDASDEEVIEAARKAHAHEFISDLPQGYETLVGERGVKLSGGQRQRIAIARAILKDAPILILDEATSALDSESEKLIQESLKELMEGKTVIAIAHRLSTIAHLDRLIVMDKGRIVEDGTHDELLKHGGLYARLWHMQSGGFLGG